MPSRDKVIENLRQALSKQDLDPETIPNTAEEIARRIDQEALRHQTPVSPETQQAAIDVTLQRNTDLSDPQREQVTDQVFKEAGGVLSRRGEAAGGLGGEITGLFDKYKTFAGIVREEVEKDVVLSIADQTKAETPTVIHLKEPLRLGKKPRYPNKKYLSPQPNN